MANGNRTGGPRDSIKDIVRSSVTVPEFDKHLKKAWGHIGRNVAEITIKMKTIVWKPLILKIIKFRLRNLDYSSHSPWRICIAMKIKTIIRIFWGIKIIELHLRSFDNLHTGFGFKYSYLIQISYTQLYGFRCLFLLSNNHKLAYKYVFN